MHPLVATTPFPFHHPSDISPSRPNLLIPCSSKSPSHLDVANHSMHPNCMSAIIDRHNTRKPHPMNDYTFCRAFKASTLPLPDKRKRNVIPGLLWTFCPTGTYTCVNPEGRCPSRWAVFYCHTSANALTDFSTICSGLCRTPWRSKRQFEFR